MRKQHPKRGARRIRTKFLLFPKRIGYETRWLEVASWEEVYRIFFLPHTGEYLAWDTERWVDNEKDKGMVGGTN